MDIFAIAVFSTVCFLWTKEVFGVNPPPPPSKESDVINLIGKYFLEEKIKVMGK